jgi:hypothetical protein
MSEHHEGGCLCGHVRYRVNGPLRDITTCHCGECRRTHGGAAPYTACPDDQLELLADVGLAWIESPHSTTNAVRGFCSNCGSSLFWKAPDGEYMAIAAGSVDEPSGLQSVGHIWWDARADWEVPDGLPTVGAGTSMTN